MEKLGIKFRIFSLPGPQFHGHGDIAVCLGI